MPLTPEQQALRKVALQAAAAPDAWPFYRNALAKHATPAAILALLAQLEAQEAPAVAALSQPVQDVPDAIRSAGFKMSNVMFNLSQAKDSPNAKLYGELYREWDAAILSVRPSPGDPAQ